MWELSGTPWERLGGAEPQVPPRASESEPVVRTSTGVGVHRGVRGAGYHHRPLIPVTSFRKNESPGGVLQRPLPVASWDPWCYLGCRVFPRYLLEWSELWRREAGMLQR